MPWSVERITQMIRAHHSTRDICRRLGCPTTTVMEIRATLQAEHNDGRKNWSEDEVLTVIDLYKQGKSGRQIAYHLNDKFPSVTRTRNSVISLLHRLRRNNRISFGAPPKTRAQMREQTFAARAATKALKAKRDTDKAKAKPSTSITRLEMVEHLHATEAIDLKGDEDITPQMRVSLEDRPEAGCRWPIGTPGHADFGYCPGARIEGLAYCERHARRAYVPVIRQRRRAAAATPAAVPVPTNETEFA